MKRILISAVMAVASSMAFAAATGSGKAIDAPGASNLLCDGANVPGGGKAQVWGGSGVVLTDTQLGTAIFSRAGFDVQCSSNTIVYFGEQSTNLAAVASGSVKGNQSFGGHTNGGAIGPSAKCTGTNDACTDANVTAAMAAALEKATQ